MKRISTSTQEGSALSPEELDALEALTDRTAPGPWMARDCGDVCCQWVAPAEDPDVDVLVDHDDRATHQFIAAARTAVPALIREVRRLQGQLGGTDEGQDQAATDAEKAPRA